MCSPRKIEELLLKQPQLCAHYQCEIRRPKHMDELTVNVEGAPGTDSVECERAGQRLAQQMKDLIGISAMVCVLPPGKIERSVGKAKRVVDLRDALH
jgi:phenylacetate-CoA ligase